MIITLDSEEVRNLFTSHCVLSVSHTNNSLLPKFGITNVLVFMILLLHIHSAPKMNVLFD